MILLYLHLRDDFRIKQKGTHMGSANSKSGSAISNTVHTMDHDIGLVRHATYMPGM